MEEGNQRGGTTVAEEMHKETKENEDLEDEDASLEEEFIKIEKEVLSMNDNVAGETMPVEQPSFTTEMDLIESVPFSEWVEAQETIKELQIKLDVVTEELNASEFEKSKLKKEVEYSNERLKERENQYHVLEVDLRKLKEESLDAELRHSIEVQSLKQVLDAQELKYQELLDIREAFDMIALELENSSKRIRKLEGDLLISSEEARKFEELSKETVKHADQESKKAAEFEQMLVVAKSRAEEMEDQMHLMQEELRSVKYLIQENQQIKKEPSVMVMEKSEVQKDLGTLISQSLVLEGQTRVEAGSMGELDNEVSRDKYPENSDAKQASEYGEVLVGEKLNADIVEKVMKPQEEIQHLDDKILEHQQLKNVLKSTTEELNLVKEQLVISENQIKELQEKLTLEEASMKELSRELISYKDSEEQANKEVLNLQAHLRDLKVEYHAMTDKLQDVEMKYEEELKARENTEIKFTDLVKEVNDLQEQLLKLSQENKSGEATLLERNDHQKQLEDACSTLEQKLFLSEKKFKEVDTLLSQSLTDKLELEQKLNSLDDLHKKTLNEAQVEITLIKEELNLSRNQAMEWEKKLITAESVIEELKSEVHLLKDSEEQAKKDMLEVQTQLSVLKEEHDVKLRNWQDIEIKYIEELQKRQASDIILKTLEKEFLDMQEQLAGISKEKESLEVVLVEHENNLQLSRDACNVLKDKLSSSEEKLKEIDLVASQALSEKHDLEEKLGSLLDVNRESAELVKIATQRSFDLQDLIKSSSAAESEAKTQMMEAGMKLEILKQRNAELEEQLIVAEMKYGNKEYEVGQLQRKIMEFEQKLGSLDEAYNKESTEEQLTLSKDKIVEWDQKLIYEGTITARLNEEIGLYKDSEEKYKKELLELQIKLSDLRMELNVKIASMQDFERKYTEEFKMREDMEVRLRIQENEIAHLKEQLDGFRKQKESLESLLAERNENMQLTKDSYNILEVKLVQAEEKLKEVNFDLSQVFSEKQDLEQRLISLVDLNKESSELAKSATKRSFELEDLVRSSNAAESEVKAQLRENDSKLELLRQRNVQLEEQLNIAEMKYGDKECEIDQLQRKILDYEKKIESLDAVHKNELSVTVTELSLVKEQLAATMEQVVEWEKKSVAESTVVEKLSKEIVLYKDSEEKSKKELSELQIQLSDLKDELNVKLVSLHDVELKYIEEYKVREAKEVGLINLEGELFNLQEKLIGIEKEKESLEALLVGRENNLQMVRDAYVVLEEKLVQSEEKLKELDLSCSHALSEKQELERRLGSLTELNRESAELVKSATKRNFELEDLVRSSNATESEVKEQIKEAETKLELLMQKNAELVEQMNLTEMKYSVKEYEANQLQEKMLDLEQMLGSLDEAHKRRLNDSLAELTLVKEQLATTEGQVAELEQKSISERASLLELNKELNLYKNSEDQSKMQISRLQIQLSDLEEELNEKLLSLQTIELKFTEESKLREAKELKLRSLENEIVNLHEQLVAIGKEKESLETKLVEHVNGLQLARDICNDVEAKLGRTEEKLKKTELVLSQSLSEKHDLEQKQGSLVQLYKESAELAKNATRRNFDLEDLVRSSSAAESEAKARMRESESKLEALHRRNIELEDQLNVAESRCSDRDRLVGQLQTNISILEQKIRALDEAHLAELGLVNGQLTASKNQVIEWEKKAISNGTLIEELKRNIGLQEDFLEQSKKELLELQTQLSDLKWELNTKVTSLQDVELKYIEESKGRQAAELSIKGLENKILNLQEQIVLIGKEKELLDELLAERNVDLQQAKSVCTSFEEKLDLSEKKLKEMDLVLSETFAEKQDLEQKLGSLVESNKESSELAKSATQRNFDLEDLLRTSTAAESEAKAHIQETELKLEALHRRNVELEEQLNATELKLSDRDFEYEEVQKKVLRLELKIESLMKLHEKALSDAMDESSLLKENLHLSKNQAAEWEQKLISEGVIIEVLKREISLCKDSEKQANDELLELQTQLSDLKEELNIKVITLQDVELKYAEESKAREASEVRSKSLEKEVSNLVDRLEEIGKEKISLEASLLEHSNELQKVKAVCSDLEGKLYVSEEESKNMNIILSQVISEKHDIEQKLGSLVELNKESAALAKSATQRSFELEDLVRSSNASELEVKQQMRNAEMKLESLHHRNAELEEQLNASEVNCSDRNYEIEQLQKKMLDLEKMLGSTEEAFSKTLAELTSVKDELGESKIHMIEWQKKSVSEGVIIEELKRELRLCMDSEEKAQRELLGLQSQLLDLEKEHNAKLASLLDLEHKHSEEFRARETIEITAKVLEKEISNLQGRLEEIIKDKASLEILSLELNSKLKQNKDACNFLEEKLSLSEENLKKCNFLLSEISSEKLELEKKLCSLEELHRESSELAKAAIQRNHDLEDLVRSSNAEETKVKSQLSDTEIKLASLQQKLLELEEALSVSESKCAESEYEVEHLRKKISELSSFLKDFEAEKELSRSQMQVYEDRVCQLDSSLSMLTKKNTELEQQVKDLTDQCTYHESEASTSKQRSLDLEDLILAAHSKSKDADSKVGELMLQLESTILQLQMAEEQKRVKEIKYKDAEADIKQLHGSVTELSFELEAIRVKSVSLETALQDASEKEEKLLELLNAANQEKKSLEISFESMSEKLSQVMTACELSERELKLANEKTRSVEKSLEDSEIKGQGMAEELNSAWMQLESQRKVAEEAILKISELELHTETLSKESDSKLKDVLADLSEKDSQIKELSKILSSVKEESSFYQGQVAEATQRVATLQVKVEGDVLTITSLQNALQEVKAKLEETEGKFERSLSEMETMTATNLQFIEDIEKQQRKIDQLQELLSLAEAEKEATADRLACHEKSLAALTEQHSRGLELHSEMESYARETAAKLQDTVGLLRVKDMEADMLNETLVALERKARIHDERAMEAANIAETRMAKLEEMQSKLRSTEEEFARKLSQLGFEKEVLSDANLKQSQELEFSKNQLQELHVRIDKLLLEKEDTVEELHSSRAIMEDLYQRLASEDERFQSKLSPIVEENNLLRDMLEETKRELMSRIGELKEKVKEEKANGELLTVQLATLQAELVLKSEMEARIEQLEQKLISVQMQHKNELMHVRAEKEELWSKLEDTACKLREREHVEDQVVHLRKELHITQTTVTKQRDLDFQKEMEREASMKKAYDEFLNEHEQKLLLEKYVMEIEQKLQTAEIKLKEKDMEIDRKQTHLVSELKNKETKIAKLEQNVIDLENNLQMANDMMTKQYIGENKMPTSVAEFNDRESKVEQLERMVMDLQKELQMANAKIPKQDMERDSNHDIHTPEIDAREGKVEELERKVMGLQTELQRARAKITKQELEIKEAKGKTEVQMRSRGFVPELTTLSKRKSKRKSEGPSDSSLANPTSDTTEPTLWESLKFVAGIAFFSMILGIILGKRY